MEEKNFSIEMIGTISEKDAKNLRDYECIGGKVYKVENLKIVEISEIEYYILKMFDCHVIIRSYLYDKEQSMITAEVVFATGHIYKVEITYPQFHLNLMPTLERVKSFIDPLNPKFWDNSKFEGLGSMQTVTNTIGKKTDPILEMKEGGDKE